MAILCCGANGAGLGRLLESRIMQAWSVKKLDLREYVEAQIEREAK
jgi:hypothetical protein